MPNDGRVAAQGFNGSEQQRGAAVDGGRADGGPRGGALGGDSSSHAPGLPLQPGLDIEDVLHSSHSFWAIIKPVCLTMALASLVVVNIDRNMGQQGGDQSMSVYTVNEGTGEGTGDTNSVKLGKSIVNALVIVGTICCVTFVVVLLYKFRCMKVLIGYMALSCTMLMGLMGGLLWETALVTWDLPCDWFTFLFVLYNFAVVGVIAIFYQKGIPMIVTQGYLVMISVIMAWQLSRFEEWTGWCLLVVLALYDLCAVLTPCGPLRYLVGLMQEYNEPMPGLLYEAQLPQHDGRPQRSRSEEQTPAAEPLVGNGSRHTVAAGSHTSASTAASSPARLLQPSEDGREDDTLPSQTPDDSFISESPAEIQVSPQEAADGRTRAPSILEPSDPLLLAAPVVSERSESRLLSQGSSHGDEEHGDHDRSIKLGLGDFVFYSVLVSKAALYGFPTCAACFLVIITGLGATLVLLSVYRTALPALPISIGLGVIFYFLTRVVIIPYINNLARVPLYV